jgi:hypothetical protein
MKIMTDLLANNVLSFNSFRADQKITISDIKSEIILQQSRKMNISRKGNSFSPGITMKLLALKVEDILTHYDQQFDSKYSQLIQFVQFDDLEQ